MGREGDLRRKMVVRGGGIVGREGRGGKCNDNYRAEGCMPEFERERILQIIRHSTYISLRSRQEKTNFFLLHNLHPSIPSSPPIISDSQRPPHRP